MSEDSMSEGFSASEDEWKPNDDMKGGESSDDDDSDFEESAVAGFAGSKTKKVEQKGCSTSKPITKKRVGVSLRTKLYNKYRPPPKTLSPSSSGVGKNSPIASTSRTILKNAAEPNESAITRHKANFGNDSGSSSDSSITNYLVKPEDLDIQSSFFNVDTKVAKHCSASPVPTFDCNAGLENHTDSASDNEIYGPSRTEKAFDFTNLLEHAKSLVRLKDNVAKHNTEESIKLSSAEQNVDNLDVYTVLALGEKQQNRSHNDGEDEDDEGDPELSNVSRSGKLLPTKLNKTKSTRIKRHTKTRPSSTVLTNDTDDSDWEEVAVSTKSINSPTTSNNTTRAGDIEIYVELPSLNNKKKPKIEDIEMALKRKLNRDKKEHQVLLHKVSLLCHFSRTYFYNRLLNDMILMKNALKLLPSKFAYPPDKGTEIKYFQSMVTWFKSVIKLKTQNLYPEKSASAIKSRAHLELLKQIESKEARSKQDMIFIMIILLRGMGLQCRLVINMQPLPLKTAHSELPAIKLKKKKDSENKNFTAGVLNVQKRGNKTEAEQKTSSIINTTKEKTLKNGGKKETDEISFKNQNEKYISLIESNLEKAENIVSNVKRSNRIRTNVEKAGKANANLCYQTKSISGSYTNYASSTKTSNLRATKRRNIDNSKAESDGKHSTTSTKNDLNTQSQNCAEKSCKSSQGLLSSQKENVTEYFNKPALGHLKRKHSKDHTESLAAKLNKRTKTRVGVPKIIVHAGNGENFPEHVSSSRITRSTRSATKSPQVHISSAFLMQARHKEEKFSNTANQNGIQKEKCLGGKISNKKAKVARSFLENSQAVQNKNTEAQERNKVASDDSKAVPVQISQLDGANDDNAIESSVEDFENSTHKITKNAPTLSKRDRRVVSSDNLDDIVENTKRKQTAGDIWLEVWCDVEEKWVCVDIPKGKIHCVDTIRKSASSPLAYVFAFQNDLTIKDVTARYCPNWTTIVRKSRVDNNWLDAAISKYLGNRTKRDIEEDEELRRIHAEKPMPSSLCDYKNHPFYALKRHLLKFEAIYPPDAPALGYIRKEPVYSRDCVHTLHSRDIWLKQARTVKLGEKPYKIVKARPKWDRFTQTVIKDQPLEIFGYWQTQDYEAPTAENGLVPRNAYGNVELFKPTMLPKKTKHIRLPGLQRICKKLGVDCANAVVGFDFHQGSCHPSYDGFIICEEFEDQVVAAWYQDQEEQEQKEKEKYEVRVYGNWKRVIRGLLIRNRLKLKYNLSV